MEKNVTIVSLLFCLPRLLTSDFNAEEKLRKSRSKQSCTLREHRIEKNRVLALSSQGAAQRDDFKEPRLSLLPRLRKALNSLT